MPRGGCCRPRVVLLDFDGTMVDTMGAYAELAAGLVEARAGLPRGEALRLYLETAGMAFRDQLRLMGLTGGLAEALAREFEEGKRRILSRLRLHPKVEWLASQLRARGLRVIVSTNNECSVVNSNKELTRVFDAILCHDPARGTGKGEPHLRLIEERLGVERCEVVFIGDSDYDLSLYRPLGVRVLRTRGLWLDAEEVLAQIDSLLAGSCAD
ncbi:MAG: HAD family hydrolase [Desulfurococcales archaeon]|nr:HAD family hydrolase [Desulfurococcales archaeon]